MSTGVRQNAIYGLAGFLVPNAIVLASYPVLTQHLGAAAFGVYLLASSLGGAAVWLDLGFSAATLKFVAEDLAAGRSERAAEVIVTALAFYGVAGVSMGLLFAVLAPWLTAVLKIDARLANDAVRAFRLAGLQFAAFLPAMVFVSIAKGIQQFEHSTIFVSLISIATYGGAIVAVLTGAGVVGAMGAGVAGNFLALVAASTDGIRLCRARGIELGAARPVAFQRLFGFGWLMTVNSISGFLLYHVQRYLVGAAMGPAAVMVYQTAAVVPSKVHALVNAATEVLFPFSSASRDRTTLRRIYIRMLGGSALVALVGFVALVALAQPLLSLWLGASLATQVAPLVPVFALAYGSLALSPAPFHLVNGLGRPGLNTVFYALNALLNIALIAVFALSGMTLAKFAWAFAVANVLTGLLYQATIETLVWRRSPELAEIPA